MTKGNFELLSAFLALKLDGAQPRPWSPFVDKIPLSGRFGSARKHCGVKLNIDEISHEHFPRIHRAALVLSGNPWDADDLAQETFLIVAHQPEKFRGASNIYTWLYGILLNLDRRERRRRGIGNRKLRVLWDNDRQQGQVCPPAETAIEVAEWKRSLWAYVDQLPDAQRETLVLRFSEELQYDEIAEVLGCPLGTVKSRIHHGLSNLKRVITDQETLASLRESTAEDSHHAS